MKNIGDRKPFLNIEQQVKLLVSDRGLLCPDANELARTLRNSNYFRLSGYAREFQRDPSYGDYRFIEGTAFDDIKAMMDCDQDLRMLLFEQLATIEIAVRSIYAYELGRAYGSDAFYLDEDFYSDVNNRSSEIVNGIIKDLSHSSSRIVSRHVENSPDGFMEETRRTKFSHTPIWVAVEVMSFGRLSNMLAYAKDIGPAKCTAAHLGVQWASFTSVIHSLSVLRNICAHHQQLWNRRLDIQCPVQKKLKPRNVSFDKNSVYAAVIMAAHYRKCIDGDMRVAESIYALLDGDPRFSEGIRMPGAKANGQ